MSNRGKKTESSDVEGSDENRKENPQLSGPEPLGNDREPGRDGEEVRASRSSSGEVQPETGDPIQLFCA